MYYYSFYLGSRIVASILYVYMYDSPKVVLSVLISMQGVLVIYLAFARPYHIARNNVWPILMEMNTLVILMLMIIYMEDSTADKDKENCNLAIVGLVFFGIAIGLFKYIINQIRPGRSQVGIDPTQELMKSELNKTQDNINKDNIGLDLSGTSYSAVNDKKIKDDDSFLEDEFDNSKNKTAYDSVTKTSSYHSPNDATVLRAEELAYDYSSSTGAAFPGTAQNPRRTNTGVINDQILKFHYTLNRKNRKN